MASDKQDFRDWFTFRPMARKDVNDVLEIVESFDEDDAEAAEETIRDGLDGLFVCEAEGKVAGFTGCTTLEDSPSSAWLSWTYVHPQITRKGVGRFMVEELKKLLADSPIRRLYISTSDYTEDGEDMYAPARAFYEAMGARKELVVPDFYEPGENRHIYRMDLGRDGPASPPPPGHVAFVGVADLEESDTSLCLLWEERESADPDVRQTLSRLLEEADEEDAEAVFVSLPEYLSSSVAAALEGAGFRLLGRVTDYYEPGIHDVYWGRYGD